jgi:hypothetical protein
MKIIGFKDCTDLYEARTVEQTYFEALHATLNSIEPLPKPTSTPKEKLEVAGKFNCAKCNFNCSKKSNFTNHTLTAKHKREMMETAKNTLQFSCDCGKKYICRSGLWKHKKKCDIINKINETGVNDVPSNSVINNSISDLIAQNKELMNLLIAKNHQTDEFIQQNKETQKTIQEMVSINGTNMKNNECSPK